LALNSICQHTDTTICLYYVLHQESAESAWELGQSQKNLSGGRIDECLGNEEIVARLRLHAPPVCACTY